MRKKILIVGMNLLIALAMVGCDANGNQQNDTFKMEEQLDLGHKYLSELDYEMAIATYMEILEVDTNSVSAYQGITEVYMQKGDYDNALKYAKEGYENTGDESLAELVKQIENLIAEEAARLAAEEETARLAAEEEAARLAAEEEAARLAAEEEAARLAAEEEADRLAAEEEADRLAAEEEAARLAAEEEAARLAAEEEAASRKSLFDGHYVDGIWHNAYTEYGLTEEDSTYLQQVIDNANAGNYENVFALLQSDKQENMLVRLGKTYSTGTGGEACIAYNEYKVRTTTSRGPYNDTRTVYLIPITDDKGYIFEYSVTKDVNGNEYINKNYATCGTKNGMYHGKVKGKRSSVSAEQNKNNESKIEGSMVNGLRHGLWLSYETRFNGTFEITMMSEYTNGKPKAYVVKPNGSNNDYVIEVKRNEDGSPDLTGGGNGTICTPERFENLRYGLDFNQHYDLQKRDNSGYWCYRY